MTGEETARGILTAANVHGVLVAWGGHSNEYDPKNRVIRLTTSNFAGETPSAIAIGAHEAGHAIQHARRYWLFMMRARLFPFARVATGVLPALLILAAIGHLHALMHATMWAYTALTLFQLLALRIEYDASNRAYFALLGYGMIAFGSDTSREIQRVLRSLLWAYVWGFIFAPLWLLTSLVRRR